MLLNHKYIRYNFIIVAVFFAIFLLSAFVVPIASAQFLTCSQQGGACMNVFVCPTSYIPITPSSDCTAATQKCCKATGVLSTPIGQKKQLTDLSTLQRCWTKKQCADEAHGIWGKSPEYADRWGGGSIDKWSQENCVAAAGVNDLARCFQEPPNIPLQIGIPGVVDIKYCSEFTLGKTPDKCSVIGEPCGTAGKSGKCRAGVEGGFPGYIKRFYEFFVAALAVMAVVMVMWGGFKRIMAAGSSEKIKAANETIGGAISGLVLALLSYSLLVLINPQLVKNAFPPIEALKPDFWDKCPLSTVAPTFYDQGYVDITAKCVGGYDSNKICADDSQCRQGRCTPTESSVKTSVSEDTCGHTLILNGRKCVAQECFGGKGCYTRWDDDTFQNAGGPHQVEGAYECVTYALKGNISPPGSVLTMNLAYVCKNSDRHHLCLIRSAGNDNSIGTMQLDLTDQAFYGVDCYNASAVENKPQGSVKVRDNPRLFCGEDGLKGFMIKIAHRRSGAAWNEYQFDWYGVDASTCGMQALPIRDRDGRVDVNKILFKWSSIADNKFIQLPASTSTSAGVTCDLNLSNANFPPY